jgi:hypothetical protein
MNINEAKRILKENGYILDEFFPINKKKKEKEEIDPALYTLPGGQRKEDGSYHYPGLIWQILGDININHKGSITKEEAIEYVNLLLPAIKENPKDSTFGKVLIDVIKAIK